MVMLLLREAVLRDEAVLPRRALSEIILRKCWRKCRMIYCIYTAFIIFIRGSMKIIVP